VKKVTKYRVSGVSNTKPEVSKDFTVEEIVEEVPMDALEVLSTRGNSLKAVETTDDGVPVVEIRVSASFRKLDVKTATELRDWLTEFVDSNQPLRVFRDNDGSVVFHWYELEPDKFVFASSRNRANLEYATVGESWTYRRLNDTYGPLTLIKQ
jgi:hypothetical protein